MAILNLGLTPKGEVYCGIPKDGIISANFSVTALAKDHFFRFVRFLC